MHSKKHRLDRFISASQGINRKHVRLMLAQKRIKVNGELATNTDFVIDQFDRVELDKQTLQDNQPVYMMMNKPVGVVSATVDKEHTTVIDLLGANYKDLHITGRLDLNTSGLLLLTNHGTWSRNLTAPDKKVMKVYQVTLKKPLTDDYITAFDEGMYFPYEGITTLPVKLEILSKYVAQVSLQEGRYHQIKRMFGRFRNPVLKLHRSSIGAICLDPSLKLGESRALTDSELETLAQSSESLTASPQ